MMWGSSWEISTKWGSSWEAFHKVGYFLGRLPHNGVFYGAPATK